VQVGPHKGSFKAWWSEITIEIYGWQRTEVRARVEDQAVKATRNSATLAWRVTIPDNGAGMLVTFE
jgi:hypothetical protein